MLAANNTIQYDAKKPVLKFQIGDEVKLKEADFALLSSVFFDEIEEKFS